MAPISNNTPLVNVDVVTVIDAKCELSSHGAVVVTLTPTTSIVLLTGRDRLEKDTFPFSSALFLSNRTRIYVSGIVTIATSRLSCGLTLSAGRHGGPVSPQNGRKGAALHLRHF